MSKSTSATALLLLLACLAVFVHADDSNSSSTANFLGESRVADLYQCAHDLLKSKSLLQDISSALKLHLYAKALQDLKLVLGDMDTAIEKCAKGTCWMEGQQRCEDEINARCERWGLLFYPVCKAGYHNNACCICSEDCPAGFRDDGLECFKPDSYGRGVGYPWEFGDPMNLDKARARCLKHNPTLGCQKYGEIIYPNCRANFHNVACCVCSPNCPSEMTDIGVSCQKKTYGRGVGYAEGKCIEENWDDYTPIEEFGKCVDMAEQIAIDIDQLIELIDNQGSKIKIIKKAYVTLQQSYPFLYHCVDTLVDQVASI